MAVPTSLSVCEGLGHPRMQDKKSQDVKRENESGMVDVYVLGAKKQQYVLCFDHCYLFL